ncbi:hypothetical protein [Streptomyces shenzhenensis]|uniref:hypothetical protein n=1 Tax=Streptomyces shenzhenensis TaxID=943815 RepID=UPI0036B15D5B
MNPLPDTSTPIYDALCMQWRADFRSVPGERGPEDVWSAPAFQSFTPVDPAYRSLEQSHHAAVPRQLSGWGTRGGMPVAVSPPPFPYNGQLYAGPPVVPTR